MDLDFRRILIKASFNCLTMTRIYLIKVLNYLDRSNDYRVI